MFKRVKKLARSLWMYFEKVKFRLRHPGVSATIEGILQEDLAYLDRASLQELAETVKVLEEKGVEGAIVEAGCARGGSAIAIAAAKNPERTFKIFDMFGTIPPPSDKDDQNSHERYEEIKKGKSNGLGDKEYYGYEEDLLNIVISNFRSFGFQPEEEEIEFIEGPFQETMPELRSQLVLVHIDADWYESVMTALKYTEPLLATGGRFIIDDYHAWGGCRKAVDEYFKDKLENYDFHEKGELHIIKKGMSNDIGG